MELSCRGHQSATNCSSIWSLSHLVKKRAARRITSNCMQWAGNSNSGTRQSCNQIMKSRVRIKAHFEDAI
eukprot:1161836-Pelagomonas_calceolata.AAC.6